jgi:tRNA1(Val) A37 N6-methylase TrmN6
MLEYTEDTFFNGRLKVRQHKDGYRYSIDAVILAACVHPGQKERIADLGTGCGIIPMILAFRYHGARIYGVEIQEELADIAKINVKTNQMNDRVRIIKGDIKSLHHKKVDGPVDVVVSNPPYRKIHSGRINPDTRRAVARHELAITLDDVVVTAKSILKTAGKFVVIYPAWRMADLLTCMKQRGLEPKRLRAVHSRFGDEARLIVVEGIKGGQSGLVVESPLYIYEKEDSYTFEMENMFLP